MAKARAIVKRRKAVRNIRKITKTMQMIATAMFQKSLKRATGTKPYTKKVRELVAELAASLGDVDHPLLRRPSAEDQTNRIALLVLTSNRGLAGAYNGNILRLTSHFIREQKAAGKTIDLYVIGMKGISNFNFQKIPITQKSLAKDMPRFADVEKLAQHFIDEFVEGKVDSVHVAYTNFISAGQQKAEIATLLPLAGVAETQPKQAEAKLHTETLYDFMPSAKELLDELLPQTVKSSVFQAFLDATTSEHVMRMVSMKSATDNADKLQKSLTMQYNRARQSQITTELSEIMGGVEAMGG
ncbi:MAG TPA: ATP synthase F1 subunit gamma [Tepidisphaeraceae bacterium]|jgi:F-type H+-transporting ATPase subunit gamma|nr:ATP synthase F1 subunit gamma [Tepidisphaeraceae bacterium]